jgi:hypothetical protein
MSGFSFSVLGITLGIAILRYRLFDIRLVIRRTLIYVPLTAIVAGIFAASITLSQRLFFALTGASSDFATGLATLITVAAFDPVKSRIERFVEARFKDVPDPARPLHTVRDRAREILLILEPRESARNVLDAAVQAFDAVGGAVLERNGAGEVAIYQVGKWSGAAKMSVPFGDGSKDGSTSVYTLALGARRNGAEYTREDRELLQQTLEPVRQALRLVTR